MDLDKFERFISNSFRNVGQGFYDSYVEANVRFRSKLGMKEVIVRRQLGNCCKWCADLAGIYDANNTPSDVFKRHRNCRCLVTHKTETKYTDLWSGKEYKTQKEARYNRIKELENEKVKTQEEKLKARQSKKIYDLHKDLLKNSDFIKNDIVREEKKYKLIPKLKRKGFSDEYHISKTPKMIGGKNVYLDIEDLSYILSSHSKDIPIEYYSRLNEVIEDYDILFQDTKKYKDGYKFFKLFKEGTKVFALDVAIRKKDPNSDDEYIVHFNYIGHKRAAKKKNSIIRTKDVIDEKNRE